MAQAKNNGGLDAKELQKLRNRIASFGKKLQNSSSLDSALKYMSNKLNRLNNIYKNASGSGTTQKGDFISGLSMNNNLQQNNRLKAAAIEGYAITQIIREFFTGQSIKYLFYLENDDGTSGFAELTLDKLLQVITFKERNVNNNETKVLAELTFLEKELREFIEKDDDVAEIKFLNDHKKNLEEIIAQDFDPAGSKMKVKWSTIWLYKDYKERFLYSANSKQELRRKQFTKGHITEAYVTSALAIMKEHKNLIRNQIFTKYLKADSVSAIQGPDTALRNLYYSIKLGNARLMRMSSIINACNNISTAINEARDSDNRDAAAEAIAAVFVPTQEKQSLSVSGLDVGAVIADKVKNYEKIFKSISNNK